jgi:hypothetical protein
MAVGRCPYEDVVSVYADTFGGITISVRTAHYPLDGSLLWKENNISIGLDDVAGVIAALQDAKEEIDQDDNR